MVFLIFFLISVLLLGTVHIGPFSIRIYATVLMALYLFSKRKEFPEKGVKTPRFYIYTFIIFVFLMCLSLLANGEFTEYGFLKKFLAYYLVCIVSYYAVDYYVRGMVDFSRVVFTIAVIMLANNILTWVQYTGGAVGWTVGQFFSDVSEDSELLLTHDNSYLGFSRCPGILGDTVKNAFFIAVTTPLYYWGITSSNRRLISIFYLLAIMLAFVACFMTQQRAAFGLLLFSLAIFLALFFRKSILALFVSLVLIVLLYDRAIDFISSTDIGRLSDFDNTNRKILFDYAVDFISKNPVFGGPIAYQRMAGMSSHNIVLDSWIYSGFFGFLCMMLLYLRTLLGSIYFIVKGFFNNSVVLFSSLAVFVSMIYGLFHNTSYLTGECIIFILLCLMLKSILFSQLISENGQIK